MNYFHGGNIYQEGIAKHEKLLDFSSNINPFGAPESFTRNINAAIQMVSKYPDINYRETKQSLSTYLQEFYKVNLSEQSFLLGNGAVEIIDLVLSSFKSVVIPVPSFTEYEGSARKNCAKVSYSYLKEDMSYNYQDIKEKLKLADALIIGNPNNPSGNIINKDSFEEILEFCEENKKTIIIDEAFIEFTGNVQDSFISEMPKYKCLFIIRALTKFFALPGIRFGYAVSLDSNLINELSKLQLPWNINCFAETAVKHVLKDKDYIDKSLNWIKEEKEYLQKELVKISFIEKIYTTNCNFVLCKLKKVTGEQLYKFCLENGLLIRRTDDFIGLDDSFIRLAIKDRELNHKMLKILSNFK